MAEHGKTRLPRKNGKEWKKRCLLVKMVPNSKTAAKGCRTLADFLS